MENIRVVGAVIYNFYAGISLKKSIFDLENLENDTYILKLTFSH